ncbi:MAG: ChbG/HpnK family deacetylase [Methanosarcinaceae archaeon]|nr:ChbG/HpnK family deacetylase [Methanosarcinaceae archaeon]
MGRTGTATDSAIACHRQKRITSASAMVFMADSRRAAELASHAGLDTGLHLNLTQPLDGPDISPRIKAHHIKICRFLCRGKWAQVSYHPFLHDSLKYTFQAQFEEYFRLFGTEPAQIDGHSHMHLCMNIIIGHIIPPGLKIRRSFTFKRGEKSIFNRLYRRLIDKWATRHYICTDSFFSIEPVSDRSRVETIVHSALSSNVELMVHPAEAVQFEYLMSREFLNMVQDVPKGSYRMLA